MRYSKLRLAGISTATFTAIAGMMTTLAASSQDGDPAPAPGRVPGPRRDGLGS